MALPATLDPNIPVPTTESARLLDDRIRELKQQLIDILGIPNGLAVTTALFGFSTDGRFSTDLVRKKGSPRDRYIGTEASAKDWQVGEEGGDYVFQENTGTEGAPVWTTRGKVPRGGGTASPDDLVTRGTLEARLPAGVVLPYGGSAAPTGWLLCDGAAVSRTTFAALFTAIGTAFGVGDGATTFNVPDLRGRAPLGVGSGTFATTFTADPSTDVLTVASQDTLQTGTPVLLTTTGTLPAPLALATTYYAIRQSATTLKLATTAANAASGTAIDLTSAGTGVHTLTYTLSTRTLGAKGGTESLVVTQAGLPPHVHDMTHTHDVVTAGLASAGPACFAIASTAGSDSSAGQSPTVTGNGGFASAALATMNPYQVLTYIIRT